MGKLQTLGNKLDESTKKMEAAQKSGDEKAQAAAAFEGLGALLGGGNRVDPIAIDQIKAFVPGEFRRAPKERPAAPRKQGWPASWFQRPRRRMEMARANA